MWRAEGEDAGAVALEDHLEGELVPAPDLLDEALVAGEREQALRAKHPDRGAAGEGSGRHGLWVVPARIAHRNAIGTPRFVRNPQTFGFDRRFSLHEEDHASGRARTDPRCTGDFSREADTRTRATSAPRRPSARRSAVIATPRARRSVTQFRNFAACVKAHARRRGPGGAERAHERRQGVQGRGPAWPGVRQVRLREGQGQGARGRRRGPAGRDRVQERGQGVRRRARRHGRDAPGFRHEVRHGEPHYKNAFGKCVSQKAHEKHDYELPPAS